MDCKGVYQIAWKIGSDCLETVILVGSELGLFIIYLNYPFFFWVKFKLPLV